MRRRALWLLWPLVGCGGGGNANEPSRDSAVADVQDAETIVDAPPPVAVEIGCGRAHSCARMSDGTVRCWGFNKSSQLGDRTRDPKNRPVVAFGVVDAMALSVGGNHACVLTSAKKLTCWGGNAGGQIGDPTEVLWTLQPTSKILPASVLAAQIALGGSHSCARISDDTLDCWGSNRFGQLGYVPSSACTTFTLGDTPCNTVPAPVPDMKGITQVALGDAHTCVRRADDSVACWGRNSQGQLGGGPSVPLDESGPRVEVVGLGKVEKLALGGEHSCALLTDGTVKCWGRDDDGQLGDGGNPKPVSTPQPVPGLAEVVDIVLGSQHTCVRMKDDSLRCFGNGEHGQLGLGTREIRKTPSAVPGLFGVKSFAAGSLHTCVVLTDGSARCFGGNSDGELGDGTNDERVSPVLVAF